MSKLRELFSDSVIYGFSNVVARFINYLLVPFHTDVFSTARYSIVSLVYAAITFLNVILQMGMESAYLRYAEDRKEASNIFKTIQLSLLGVSTVAVVLLWLFMPVALSAMNLDSGTSGIYIMMLGILWFDTLAIVPFAELRLVRKSIQFAILKTLHVIINVGLNFYLILSLDYGIEAVFIANLVASVIITGLIWAVTADLWKGEWSQKWVGTIFRFGLPFIPAGLGHATNEMLDRFLLNSMDPSVAEKLYGSGITPEDVVGIYSACYKLAVFMLLMVQMYRMAWQPFFMRYSRDEESATLFSRAFIYFNAFAAVAYLVVALFREQIVAINVPVLNATLINSEYWPGLEIVPLLLLAYWFQGWYINFSSGIFIKEKTSVLYKITLLGAGITLAVNLALIPYYGMMGSAAATLASYGVMAFVLGIYSKRVMEVNYRIPLNLGLMIFCVILVYTAPLVSAWMNMSYVVASSLLLIPGLAAIGGYIYFTER
ncbi:lipopolysaccharide biosynthesis protein [Rhodohalobacter sp. 8-1]|uniref:lipopolysaccharide biosynthesis protein n=1 Tax=Rhodohalobacter sp. 8-1 TaxID=3131972 RepID=UPI0030EB7281